MSNYQHGIVGTRERVRKGSEGVYYNTTKEKGEALKEATKKAGSQDERILKHFQKLQYSFGKNELSPSDIHTYFAPEWPITSIRRSLNTLTNQGKLEKTNKLVMGMYGRKEHVWRLRK